MTKVFPNLTALKQLSFTYQTPYENLQATPTALPTTEPTTPQISYTVTSADLPTISQSVESKIYVVLMYAGGKNTDTVTRYVYWRMLKNGVPIATGNTSFSANYFWTLSSFFYDVAVGDVLGLRLWADSTLVNWDYEARQIQVSRVALHEKDILWLYQIKSLSEQPVLTLGNPSAGFKNLYVYHKNGTFYGISSATDFLPWQQHSIHKLFKVYHGDSYYPNGGRISISSTYRPYYNRNLVPTLIHIRALKTIF